MVTPEEITDFWLSEPSRTLWFSSTPEFDRELHRRFHAVWEMAAKGQLDHWAETPRGAVALVIVLDQLPLNMFRGRARSFSTEARSREIAASVIDNGQDAGLSRDEKLFLYLPYMHSETLSDQDRAVALFEAAGLETSWALHHQDIVRRFGRFPHRNEPLGRRSSEAELAYLASDEGFKG